MTKGWCLGLGLLALVAPVFAAQAQAGGFTGLAVGEFAYTRVPSSPKQNLFSIDTDQYTFKLAGLYTFDNPGFGIQLDTQDDFYFGKKFNLSHLWSAGGSVFFRDNKGTVGISGSYSSVDAPAAPLFKGKTSVESFGLFGEYYVLRNLTLQAKFGGTAGAVGEASAYGGAGLTWYDSPDLALHLESNFTSYSRASNWTNVNASIEYLPFQSMPVSIYAGYDYLNMSGLGYTYASTFFAGLKYHLGQGRVLSDYQRTGVAEWTGVSQPGANVKF